jgi:hypothetical protein
MPNNFYKLCRTNAMTSVVLPTEMEGWQNFFDRKAQEL